MVKSNPYLFTSARLGFRNWENSDINNMTAINTNKNVMRFFPEIRNETQTKDFIIRMQQLYTEKGYCYFAVDILETNEFIGFIGLNDVNYKASFSPGTDIGWRLAEKHWGNGYATEGAKRCVSYAFEILQLESIVSVAPEINTPSISVMKKIGMNFKLNFKHPSLLAFKNLENCACFELNKLTYFNSRSCVKN